MLVLIRPANQILLPLALAPLIAYVAWRRRFVLTAACVAAALLPLAAWALHNGVRYEEPTVARGGRAWVPFLQVFTSNKTIAPENGEASQRLGELIEREVLSRDPHASLDVTLDAYLANGSNYETVRLIALSDTVLGRDENYDVLFDSALEAIREHPGTYFRGVARHVLGVPRPEAAPRGRRPARADGSRGACSDLRVGRRRAPQPPGHRPARRRPVRLRLVRVRLHRLVHRGGSRRQVWSDPGTQERYREIVAQVRAWDAELPAREGVDAVTEILNRVTPRFPTRRSGSRSASSRWS